MANVRQEKSAVETPTSSADTLPRTIEKAKRELEQMIDLSPQVMLLVDRNGVIIRANKTMLGFLRVSEFRAILGKRMGQIFRCDDSVFFNHLLNDRHGGYDARDCSIKLPDESSRLLRFTCVASGPDTDLRVVIIEDMSAEKDRATHLEKRHKKEAVQNLMGALMHTINQPLTVITVKAQLMHVDIEKGNVNPEEMADNLQDIMKLAMHIADILGSIETPRDFVTQPYLNGTDILDIEKSGNRTHGWENFCVTALQNVIAATNVHEPWASAHAGGVGRCAGILAERMGLDEKMVETVKRSGALHDIGKIGVPDSILQKPSPLSSDEKELMKKHSDIGYNLLRSFPFLAEEALAAYAHHERHDGSGYPRGISGVEIPLIARIIAVADTFDALRCNRAYQPPVPLDRVVSEIALGSGAKFDPEVVRVFLLCYQELDSASAQDRKTTGGLSPT